MNAPSTLPPSAPTTEEAQQTAKLVGGVAGFTEALAARDDYACIGQGYTIVVLDIAKLPDIDRRDSLRGELTAFVCLDHSEKKRTSQMCAVIV